MLTTNKKHICCKHLKFSEGFFKLRGRRGQRLRGVWAWTTLEPHRLPPPLRGQITTSRKALLHLVRTTVGECFVETDGVNAIAAFSTC